MIEIEWWYQEYDQYGNLIFEDYVYSTYECWGGGGNGGGGGGSSPTPTEMCQINNTAALNTVIESNLLIIELPEQNSELARTKLYSWQYAKAGIGGTLKGLAYDRGIHVRVNTKKATPWTWQSLENVGNSVQGTFIGPPGTSLTLSVVHTEPIIGIYTAKMFLVWKADVSTSRGGIVLHDYNTKTSVMHYIITTTPIPGF